ncbi:MAG: ferredoxin [Rhodobacteraceae bacterium]|nr:ferredoxin [Paracoccaceae bacterium]
MNFSDIDAKAAAFYLQIYGGFTAGSSDTALPPDTKSLLLLGPKEPGFWPYVSAEPEFLDGQSNPLDRWSRRAIDTLASDCAAQSLFPFGGPPWLPFTSWALRTGRCWVSPIQFLVHDMAGLMVSFRGALAIPYRIKLPRPPLSAPPCASCQDKPCITACPANALDDDHYDSQACIDYTGSPAGHDCLMRGCAVRRICPVSMKFPRREAQSHFHQKALINSPNPP